MEGKGGNLRVGGESVRQWKAEKEEGVRLRDLGKAGCEVSPEASMHGLSRPVRAVSFRLSRAAWAKALCTWFLCSLGFFIFWRTTTKKRHHGKIAVIKNRF